MHRLIPLLLCGLLSACGDDSTTSSTGAGGSTDAIGSSETGSTSPPGSTSEDSGEGTSTGGSSSGNASSSDSGGGAATCETGLPKQSSESIACGADECAPPLACCIDAATCDSTCPNLDIAWACDRNAHCGGDEVCCITTPFGIDDSTCPGASAIVATECVTGRQCSVAGDVVCQTDADCSIEQACYAIALGNTDRIYGVCR
jgi:hypothetical protein